MVYSVYEPSHIHTGYRGGSPTVKTVARITYTVLVEM